MWGAAAGASAVIGHGAVRVSHMPRRLLAPLRFGTASVQSSGPDANRSDVAVIVVRIAASTTVASAAVERAWGELAMARTVDHVSTPRPWGRHGGGRITSSG